MAARRRTQLETEEIQRSTGTGGHDWDFCVKEFLVSMTLRNLSHYTKNTIEKTLVS